MPVTNQIATSPKAAVIAANLKAECPIWQYGTRKMESKFEAGTGSVANIICVDYGKVYESTDGDIRNKDRKVYSIKVPVTVNYKTSPVELHQLDHMLNLKDYDTQVVKPRISLLASKVNEEAIGTSVLAASGNVVVDSPDSASFKMLAAAVAQVRKAKMDGRIAGVLSHDVQAAIAGTGTNMFSANNSLGDSLYAGKINMFAGADWIQSADTPLLENPQAIAGARLAAPIANGAKAISITFASSGTLKKYTPFTITGVNNVNSQGRNLATPRTFVVSEDTEFTDATVSVPVEAELFFERTAAGFINMSGAGSANAAVNFPLAAKTYNVGSVFVEKAVAFASLDPKPLRGGVQSARSNIDGVNVLMSVDSNVETLEEICRWDVLTGSRPLYQQGALGIYVPVA
jgi:hypothetical protein